MSNSESTMSEHVRSIREFFPDKKNCIRPGRGLASAVVATGVDAARTLIVSPFGNDAASPYFLVHVYACGPRVAETMPDELQGEEYRPRTMAAVVRLVEVFLSGGDDAALSAAERHRPQSAFMRHQEAIASGMSAREADRLVFGAR